MPIAASDLAALIGAVLLAGIGGEAFLKSILGAAAHLRVPKAVAATTLAAFATSSPELTVSLDGRIGRGEGATLLVLFAVWLGVILRAALHHRQSTLDQPASVGPGPWLTLALGIFGLGALIAAGRLFVLGATGVAAAFQIDAYVIGVLVVAIGTSLPELVTVLLSRLRGHDEVGVGTLIGSNLFNGLAIVGVASGIHPISVPPAEIITTLACGVAALLLLLPNRTGLIPRGRGLLLLAL